MSSHSSNPIAAITGAASGLGASFARELAGQGYDLLLVDRDGENLAAVGDQIHNSFDVGVSLVEADLSNRHEVESLARRLADTPTLQLLVNNAGYGHFVDFIGTDLAAHLDMISVQVETPMRLVHAVLPGMRQRNQGAIINVSSLGAFAPCAGAVQYSATKSYLVVFSEALQEELRGTNVRVQVLCPGFVHTGFHDTGKMNGFDQGRIPNGLWMIPDEVVQYSLRSLRGSAVLVIPGWHCRFLGWVMRMPLLKPLVRSVMRTQGRAPSGHSAGVAAAPSPGEQRNAPRRVEARSRERCVDRGRTLSH